MFLTNLHLDKFIRIPSIDEPKRKDTIENFEQTRMKELKEKLDVISKKSKDEAKPKQNNPYPTPSEIFDEMIVIDDEVKIIEDAKKETFKYADYKAIFDRLWKIFVSTAEAPEQEENSIIEVSPVLYLLLIHNLKELTKLSDRSSDGYSKKEIIELLSTHAYSIFIQKYDSNMVRNDRYSILIFCELILVRIRNSINVLSQLRDKVTIELNPNEQNEIDPSFRIANALFSVPENEKEERKC